MVAALNRLGLMVELGSLSPMGLIGFCTSRGQVVTLQHDRHMGSKVTVATRVP